MRVCVIGVLMLLSHCRGDEPGVQVILTSKGLQYVKHASAGWIQDKLEQITFPDISGDVNIYVGTVHYTLSGMTIIKLDLPEPSVAFVQESTALQVSITGLSMALSGQWMTNFGLIHDGGTLDMAMFDLSVAAQVQLGRDAEGHLSVSSSSCTAAVRDVAAQFHGCGSFIVQAFVKHFKGFILGKIESMICPEVQASIDQLENLLRSMAVSFAVNEVLTLDLPLTEPPWMDASNLLMGLQGEFISTKTKAEPPFGPQPFVLPEPAGFMLSVGLSEFSLNSASYGYFSAGELRATVTDAMIPPTIPLRLNTTSMGMFAPQLPKLFPGLLMTAELTASEAPLLSLTPGALRLGAKGRVLFSAVAPNGTLIQVFTLASNVNFTGKMWINDEKLKGTLNVDNFTLTLDSSKVGEVKVAALQNVADMGLNMALKEFNDKLKAGILLPRLKQAQLVNPVLNVERGFIAISSDAEMLFQRDGGLFF